MGLLQVDGERAVGVPPSPKAELDRLIGWPAGAHSARSPAFVKQSGAHGAVERSKLLQDRGAVVHRGVGVDHDVADFAVGLEVLSGDIEGAAGKYLDDAAEDPRDVAVDVEISGPACTDRNLDLREVDRAHGGSRVAVFDQLARDLRADALLRLRGRAADMRRENDVLQPLERRMEGFVADCRLLREDVDRGPAETPSLERRGERVQIDDRAAAVVDEEGP